MEQRRRIAAGPGIAHFDGSWTALYSPDDDAAAPFTGSGFAISAVGSALISFQPVQPRLFLLSTVGKGTLFHRPMESHSASNADARLALGQVDALPREVQSAGDSGYRIPCHQISGVNAGQQSDSEFAGYSARGAGFLVGARLDIHHSRRHRLSQTTCTGRTTTTSGRASAWRSSSTTKWCCAAAMASISGRCRYRNCSRPRGRIRR